MKLTLVNAQLATPFRRVHGYLIAQDGLISNVGVGEPEQPLLEEAKVVDLRGRLRMITVDCWRRVAGWHREPEQTSSYSKRISRSTERW